MGKRIPIILGFILLIIAVLLLVLHFDFLEVYLNRLENLSYDVQLRTKLLLHPEPLKTSIVIVDVDDKSIEKEGRWPWSRSKLATLVTKLQQAGAVVISFDVFFPTSELNMVTEVEKSLSQNKLLIPPIDTILKKIQPTFDNDALFAASLSKSDNVLGMSFLFGNLASGELPNPSLTLTTPAEKQLDFINAGGYIGNIPILQNAAKNAGFVNVFPDDDGVVRRVPLLIRYGDNLYPLLALESVRLFLLGNINLRTGLYRNSYRVEGVELANYLIPTDEKSQVIVPFRGRAFTFPYFSATDLLHDKIPPNSFAGKLIFVGTSATGLSDLKSTAIQSVFPGVEIQATIADGILRHNFSYRPPWAIGLEVFITVFLGVIFVLTFPGRGPRTLSFIIIFVPIALIFLNNWLWAKTGLIISILVPIVFTIILAFLNIMYGYLFETLRRERLKEMFGQYVPAKHIDEMLAEKGSYALHGEDRIMTVLFADIRNFTTISEPLSASQIKEILNTFFTPMTEIIFKHRGTIDKYVGDLIMAFWGAPLKDRHHARHAISAAIDMQEKIKKLEPELVAKGWPAIRIGIGINTGEMSVGDMGSKYRRNYTVLGDAVNLASRLEPLCKYYAVEIIVTESTMHDETHFVFQQLDRVRVKGKQNAITIFSVVCRKSDLTPEISQKIDETNQALESYFQQNWQKARELFSQLYGTYPREKMYGIFLDRVNAFEQSPPPKDWDGVFTLLEK